MRSGAEEIDYSKDLPAGTLQLLDLMEKMLSENDLRIFPEDLYAQGHVLHSPEAVVYSPKRIDGDGLAGRMRGRCAAALR